METVTKSSTMMVNNVRGEEFGAISCVYGY